MISSFHFIGKSLLKKTLHEYFWTSAPKPLVLETKGDSHKGTQWVETEMASPGSPRGLPSQAGGSSPSPS